MWSHEIYQSLTNQIWKEKSDSLYSLIKNTLQPLSIYQETTLKTFRRSNNLKTQFNNRLTIFQFKAEALAFRYNLTQCSKNSERREGEETFDFVFGVVAVRGQAHEIVTYGNVDATIP